ncbi:ATP-binding cassette domain-containing protein [Virgibacillus halodenitrificans]|uniref:ATP-binding cassette domain-containing protein n=1 Tax=Virgibacillus halodenitrificans TaxID=1482 RepID=UPI0002F706D6|nr:ABC transporter ATP-binding protein [Virgibacillus halodenitrificans]
MNVIECDGLNKIRGKVNALHNLSFTIKEDTITGLVGRNGAGKTTLMKVIAGMWRETSGTLRVFNKQPFNNLFVSVNSIYIDDQLRFNSSLTLSEILKEAERFYPNWDTTLALRLFSYFSFNPKDIHENLSKGKKSTFNAIIGLASHCALTMFDEPTTGMDAAVRKDFYRALLKDYLNNPRTILISSHHVDEIEDLIEDIFLIERGEVLAHLPMDEFKEYAIGLTGRTEIVSQWSSNKKVLYQKTNEMNRTFMVVKNEAFPLEQAKRLGIETSSISASDLAIYLTNQRKEGIDNVFK